MNPLISVIVPIYNAETYLQACFDSILLQDYSAIEVIAVDDGSTDGSAAICDAYRSDERVRVIHTDNHGASHARNIGLENARGEYIAFLDADDALEDGALTYLYDLITTNRCDMAVGTKRSYRADGSSFKTEYPQETERWSGREGLMASLSDHPATYAVWGKLYRRSLTDGIRFEEGRSIHEDSFFVFTCMLREPEVIVNNRVAVRYHLSENSVSRNKFSQKQLDILFFAQKKCSIIHRDYPELSDYAENVMIKAYMALLKKITLCDDAKYRSLEKECLRYVREHKKAFIPATESDVRLFRYVTRYLYYPRKLLLKLMKNR